MNRAELALYGLWIGGLAATLAGVAISLYHARAGHRRWRGRTRRWLARHSWWLWALIAGLVCGAVTGWLLRHR